MSLLMLAEEVINKQMTSYELSSIIMSGFALLIGVPTTIVMIINEIKARIKFSCNLVFHSAKKIDDEYLQKSTFRFKENSKSNYRVLETLFSYTNYSNEFFVILTIHLQVNNEEFMLDRFEDKGNTDNSKNNTSFGKYKILPRAHDSLLLYFIIPKDLKERDYKIVIHTTYRRKPFVERLWPMFTEIREDNNEKIADD